MTPERYPEVIKHELTHACVFDIFSRYTNNDLHLPIENDTEGTLREDCDYALDTFNILLGNTEDEVNSELFNDILTFYEFVADFLMYEAEGQTKEKNPAPEVNPKKKDVKLRITYRTLTPLDRFEEHIEHNDVDRVKDYEPIIAALRSSYSDYEAFLESVRI
jgi:hypothetical protein